MVSDKGAYPLPTRCKLNVQNVQDVTWTYACYIMSYIEGVVIFMSFSYQIIVDFEQILPAWLNLPSNIFTSIQPVNEQYLTDRYMTTTLVVNEVIIHHVL